MRAQAYTHCVLSGDATMAGTMFRFVYAGLRRGDKGEFDEYNELRRIFGQSEINRLSSNSACRKFLDVKKCATNNNKINRKFGSLK